MALSLLEFELLFKSNHGRLCLLANRIVQDTDGAKDIVQEVFIKVWKQKDQIHPDALNAYLYKATTNTALNYLEKNTRHHSIDDELKIVSNDNSDKYIREKQLREHITIALQKLPPKCRVIFALNRFEGMKYAEIAQQLDISLKTVENQMGKALMIMREELKPFITDEFILLVILSGQLSLILS